MSVRTIALRGALEPSVRGGLLCSLLVALLSAGFGCGKREDNAKPKQRVTHPAPKVQQRDRPEVLYLPDGGDIAPPPPAERLVPQPPPTASSLSCPADMVDVAGRFCIDRYEASLVDASSGRHFSPYYSPTPTVARRALAQWSDVGLAAGAPDTEMPSLPSWQLQSDAKPQAVSVAGVIPNGSLSGILAAEVCENAGKRLCQPDEWVFACRGQQGRKFPYGDRYEQGRCNVFREAHPAVLLHGNASIGHQDPRLNLAKFRGDRLLRPTGATNNCRSQWGDDAIYDMVGNLDEWVDEPTGAFQGGFFSRATKEGCDARISVHPPEYFDYSLGVRCCQ
ncbi:MAG: SUMF1/EgtB/PvdO family nonheme iron enzyme [Polyangiaceae bacterium]|nr:SUMF1/EgtB/PvdO family nonheme iron enzyme [Polyangiaceae bacterium]